MEMGCCAVSPPKVSFELGALVLMPISPPAVSVRMESPSVPAPSTNLASWFWVVAAAIGSPSLADACGVRCLSQAVLVVALPASAKAAAGRPPRVSASAAFKAYGTLTSSTRACSARPG